MSELKLLNCPFCGGEAVIQKLSDSTLSFAVCVDCRMRTPTLQDGKTAMRVWNTRKPMDNIVEKLEKLADNSNDHMYESYFDGKEDGIREAINIVKQEINNGLE